DGTTSASCDVAFTIEAGATRTALTTSLILTGSQMALIPIELTGGLEKLAAATGSAVSTASGSVGAVSASGSDSGASSIMANGRGGDVLALVMFSAISVSVGALMML
ncbi:hypothetical protein D6C83_01124, partial [Aureobasidium pullulans]